MPRRVLLSKLVLRAQQLADMENDPSVDATEWTALISEAYGEAYEVVAAEGTRYFETTHTYTTDGTNRLPEQADQLSVVDRLELILDASTGRCRRLRPITPQQRAALSGRIGPPRYSELVDDTWYLYPTPPTGQQLTVRYIAQCPDLTDLPGATSVDCYCMAGQKFVQYAAAMEAVDKSKNLSERLAAKLDLQRKLLTEWASDRFMNDQPVWYVEDDDDDCVPSGWSV